MTPFQPKPVVDMVEAVKTLRSLLDVTILDAQRLSLLYREAGQVELAEFTTSLVQALDHKVWMLGYVPDAYNRRMRDQGI